MEIIALSVLSFLTSGCSKQTKNDINVTSLEEHKKIGIQDRIKVLSEEVQSMLDDIKQKKFHSRVQAEAMGYLNFAYLFSNLLSEIEIKNSVTKDFVIKQRKLIDDIMLRIGGILYVLEEKNLIKCKCNELPTGINYSIKKDDLGNHNKCICIKGNNQQTRK